MATTAAKFSTNLYDPQNLAVAGYGRGQDPFGAGGSAASLAENTATSNLSAAPDIAKVSDLVNKLNEAAQQSLNAGRLGPQGEQIQSNLLGNIEAGSRGEIDPATEQMLRQGLAESGQAGGFGVDSANLSSAYDRALGINIATREEQAQKDYLDMLGANPSAPLYDASKSLVTPDLYSQTASAQAARKLDEEKLAMTAAQFNQKQAAEKAALAPKGFNREGNFVPGGPYGYGYFDPLGRFHGNSKSTSVGAF